MVVKANYVLCFLRKIVASSLSDFPSGLVPVRLHLQYCVQFCHLRQDKYWQTGWVSLGWPEGWSTEIMRRGWHSLIYLSVRKGRATSILPLTKMEVWGCLGWEFLNGAQVKNKRQAGASSKRGNSMWTEKNDVSQWEWLDAGTDFQERLCVLHLLNYSRFLLDMTMNNTTTQS